MHGEKGMGKGESPGSSRGQDGDIRDVSGALQGSKLGFLGWQGPRQRFDQPRHTQGPRSESPGEKCVKGESPGSSQGQDGEFPDVSGALQGSKLEGFVGLQGPRPDKGLTNPDPRKGSETMLKRAWARARAPEAAEVRMVSFVMFQGPCRAPN